MNNDNTKLNFPILPDSNGGDNILSIYVKERQQIQSANDLYNFVTRWKSIFILSTQYNCAPEREKTIISILDCTFDINSVWHCMNSICEDENCVGILILVPPALYQTLSCAKQFGVPTDITFIQLFQLHHLL